MVPRNIIDTEYKDALMGKIWLSQRSLFIMKTHIPYRFHIPLILSKFPSTLRHSWLESIPEMPAPCFVPYITRSRGYIRHRLYHNCLDSRWYANKSYGMNKYMEILYRSKSVFYYPIGNAKHPLCFKCSDKNIYDFSTADKQCPWDFPWPNGCYRQFMQYQQQAKFYNYSYLKNQSFALNITEFSICYR